MGKETFATAKAMHYVAERANLTDQKKEYDSSLGTIKRRMESAAKSGSYRIDLQGRNSLPMSEKTALRVAEELRKLGYSVTLSEGKSGKRITLISWREV